MKKTKTKIKSSSKKLKLPTTELVLVKGKNGEKHLTTVSTGSQGWQSIIREPYTGAWQQNKELKVGTPLSHFAVYRCISVIAQSIAKVPFELRRKDSNNIWKNTSIPNVDSILREPNSYQNYLQFKESWMISKLSSGNTYVLKVRDQNGYVVSLRILDPNRVTALVSDSGDIYYQLNFDNLSGIRNFGNSLTVPASEIVHDRCMPFFHPLIGISPMYAALRPALSGLKIVEASSEFFANSCQPGGILTAPGNISEQTALSLKEYFESNFTGSNAGAIAVVGDGMEFSSLSISAVDSQLIEQLKFSAEQICASFGVPLYMVLGSSTPSSGNIESQTVEFYNNCLQYHIESMELEMDKALELNQNTGSPYQVFLNLKELFRMDTASRFLSHKEALGAGWKKLDEVRAEEDMDPMEGGDTAYLQVQNYSVAALAKRDAQDPLSIKTEEVKPETTTIETDDKPSDSTPVVSVEEPIQNTAMNGAQISSLLSIIEQVSSGMLPKASAAAIISVSFPTLDMNEVNGILDPIIIKPPTTETTDVVQQVVDEDVDDENSNPEKMAEYIRKTFEEALKNA